MRWVKARILQGRFRRRLYLSFREGSSRGGNHCSTIGIYVVGNRHAGKAGFMITRLSAHNLEMWKKVTADA
jgi:hypothetical protein